MKKIILCSMILLATSQLCVSQEWLTSIEAAKRIALVQDKFLFVMWENATEIPYPFIMNDGRGNEVVFDNLFSHENINKVIWDYFVPVKMDETLYAELYDHIKETRPRSYLTQFEDDNIKIMDMNLNILNTSFSPEAYFNLSDFIGTYALSTSFLNAELHNYAEQQDFSTSYRLASKYMDYAILVNDNVRKDVINLALVYLDEADRYLLESSTGNKSNYEQKISLLRASQYLLQDRPRKVLRLLKKFDATHIEAMNDGLFAFLHYSAYRLKNDHENAELWKSKVSSSDIRKAQLITKLHL